MADIESAYGSETVSISEQIVKKERFLIQESTEEKRCRYHNNGQTIAMFMVAFVLTLILIHSYLMSSDIRETRLMVSKIQIQLDKLPKQEDSKEIQENFEMKKEEFFEEEKEKIEEALSKVLKEVKPIVIKEEKEIPIMTSLFNSANYLFGARVDITNSSRSDLPAESDIALLDRPEPPANRAWCSDEKEPVLTVNLARYIKPTAVSYQNFKWNGTVPDGSPKVFNVLACLDFNCQKTEPLISNCEYKSSGEIQEQVFHIPFKTKSIGKVQFHFLKNHGNVNKTCVSLIRVYGESTDVPKMEEYKRGPSSNTCVDFRDKYHNNPNDYHKWTIKTCDRLFQTVAVPFVLNVAMNVT
uniref:SUN domain-containing protein n=1 Tax=Caenorhabditis tropicalis TaxID=1561998 RepID=A0A1I7USS4_9PELO